MSKDGEILPPDKSLTKKANTPLATADNPAVPAPTGIVSAAITGFVADLHARSYNSLTARVQAQTGLTDALTGLAESRSKLGRAIGALSDLGATLDNDQAERDEQRARDQHQRDVAAKRRAAELEDSDIERETRRLQLLKAQKEAQFQLSVTQDGLKHFNRSEAVRQQFRDEVLAAKVDDARGERFARLHPDQPASSSLQEAERAYVELLEKEREKALATGNHDEALKIAGRIAKLTGGST
jgi:uncharacterized membrane protein YccC